MTKALITGSKGFIGQNLLEVLLKDFIVFEINEEIFKYPDWNNQLWLNLMNFNPDVIFHVGACSDTLEQNVNYMMELNFEFTKSLVDWSKQNNKKLIYSSSAANYGINGLNPSNLYGWSKYVAEQYVISNNGIALRYFNVYGPKEEHKGKMASVAYQFYQKNLNKEECKLFPQNPRRDFVYVRDVINANVYAFENYNDLNLNYYDVGCGEARSFEDVMKIMNIPYSYHEENKIPKGYQFYTCSNKEKWMKGLVPKYSLEKGLLEYKEYLIN